MERKSSLRFLTVSALLMAANIMMSSIGLPVPGGHIYLNDVIIDTAALLLPPFWAFAVGGIGSFLGDLFFYPTPMFVSLVTHGLQAVVISLCVRRSPERPKRGGILGVTLGAFIMVVGYSLGRAFLYATPAAAWLKLPYQILQAAVGAVASIVLCFRFGLKKRFDKTH